MSVSVAFASQKQSAVGPHVAMVAGETSGDLLAGLLLDGMQSRWPEMVAAGIGGTQMQKRAFDAWWSSDKLAVRGYVEVLRHYRQITQIRDSLRVRLLQQRPDIFVGVDAPDFNLDLERALKKDGIKTVQFVCPSVWAWRADRLERIRNSVGHVLCLFPFEPELLNRHGIEATYVGHPLAGVIPLIPDKQAARKALGFTSSDEVVAILPGSRASEIQYLARRFFDAAVVLKKERPSIRFVLPAIPSLEPLIRRISSESGAADYVQILSGQSYLALAACDVTLVASGTATLEAALFKRPMVIAYNMHWASWQIMRRKRLQPWVGLPNILCREFVVPELLQDQATPSALADAVGQWLDAPERIEVLQQRFANLHAELIRDTPKLATDAIEKILSG